MEFDFQPDMHLANLDRRLAVFHSHFNSLDDSKRKCFVQWVQAIGAAFPKDFPSLTEYMLNVGNDENRVVRADIEILFLDSSQSVRIPPQILKQAVEAWEMGEEFTPPPTWDYI
jgi:hypothetical protein